MTKSSRKKKRNKQPKLPTIVSPSHETMQTPPLPSPAAKLEPDNAVLTSKEIFITAPIGCCSDMLATQLEQPHEWDTTVIDVKPASNVRGRVGATSQVTLNIGGKRLESAAMISRYRPNRSINWVCTEKPRAKEDWWLEPKPHGTMVHVTLGYAVNGWLIRHLLFQVMRRKKIEQDLDKMLKQLKTAIESISRDKEL